MPLIEAFITPVLNFFPTFSLLSVALCFSVLHFKNRPFCQFWTLWCRQMYVCLNCHKNRYFQAYTNNLKVCLSTEIKWYWGRTYSSFPYNFTVAILLLITSRYHDKPWESNPHLRIPTDVMWMTSAFSTVLHWKMSPLWQCARFRSWKRQVLSIDLEYAWTWHMWTFHCRIIICPKHWPGDHRLACEVEPSQLTSQASLRLSAMKIFYANIICGRKVLQ